MRTLATIPSGRMFMAVLAAAGVMAALVSLTALPGSARADGHHADISVNVSEAEPGHTITVEGSGFRVGTEASFIYVSTITIGGVPIAGVSGVDASTTYLHAGRTTDSGLYIAEHIDIDPADTAPDGAWSADFVLPDNLSAGDHELVVTSCWGGEDESYPEDGVPPCGTEGLGGGVNDYVATATINILEPSNANLSVSVSEANAGDTIKVEGSGFRIGTEASFIYVSTITVGGVPIAAVSGVDDSTAFLHDGRTTDSGLYIAQHIDVDPADTEADGAFRAYFVLPDNLPAGDHYIEVTSCWGGEDESYPEDGVAPCGTVGLGGGVNDNVARARISISLGLPNTGSGGLANDGGLSAGLIGLTIALSVLLTAGIGLRLVRNRD